MPAPRFHAPYLEWAKSRPSPRFDLAGSNILPCALDDLPGAREAIDLRGGNETGYAPLIEAIAARYGLPPDRVTTAQGASGANFLACAALLEPGDDVLVESPGYDPLLAAPRLLGATVHRFSRDFAAGYAIDPGRIRRAMTPRTRLIVITSPHNPSGVIADPAALDEVGRIAEAGGAHVLLDEVYLDAAADSTRTFATRGDLFVCTSSLTKSYGLYGLRCGWIVSAPAVARRLRLAQDIVEGSGSIVSEQLATIAFAHLDHLIARTRGLLAANHSLAGEFLASRDDLDWIPTAGTVVFPRLRAAADATAFVERLLNEHQTAVVPGRFFEAPPHIRVGLGGDTASLRGGLRALGAALDELAGLHPAP